MTLKKWYAVLVITAFISVISFFQINSYFADKHKINWLFIVVGVLFAIATGYSFYMCNKLGNPGKPK